MVQPLVVSACDGWLVQREGTLVHVGTGDDMAALDVVSLASANLGDWTALVREVAGRIAGTGYLGDPSVVMLHVTDAGTSVFVHGSVAVALEIPRGTVRLSGSDVATWVERQLPGAATTISIGLDAPEIVPDATGTIELPAVTVSHSAGSPLQPPSAGSFAPGDAPAGSPLPPPAVRPVPSGPLPHGMVYGVQCTSGHANEPQASGCRVCGLPIAPSVEVMVVARPSLGVLEVDDGRVVVLTRPCVFGRKVPEQYMIDDELAMSVALNDERNHVSQRHIEVRLVGWDVVAVDLGSTNGTRHRGAGTESASRLTAFAPQSMRPGDQLILGNRVLTYRA